MGLVGFFVLSFQSTVGAGRSAANLSIMGP
jgi:hypothetical protein